jgi:hypothetical protein
MISSAADQFEIKYPQCETFPLIRRLSAQSNVVGFELVESLPYRAEGLFLGDRQTQDDYRYHYCSGLVTLA